MKKVLLFCCIAALSFISCSKDDSAAVAETIILPKKVISSSSLGGTSTTIITYDGAKLVEVSNGNDKSKFTYNGDMIVKVQEFDGSALDGTTDYVYDNNKLKSALSVETSVNQNTGAVTVISTRRVYTHNANGTILEESFTRDPTTGALTFLNNKSTYTFSNGNLVKEVNSRTTTYNNGNTNVTQVYTNTDTYEYDTKNNPLMNVVGYNKIDFSKSSSKNNALKETSISEVTNNGVPSSPQTSVSNYIFKYNTNDFLSEQTYTFQTGSGTATLTTQFFYD